MVTTVDAIAFRVAAVAGGMVEVVVFQPRPGLSDPSAGRPDGMQARITPEAAREIAAVLVAEAAIAQAGRVA